MFELYYLIKNKQATGPSNPPEPPSRKSSSRFFLSPLSPNQTGLKDNSISFLGGV